MKSMNHDFKRTIIILILKKSDIIGGSQGGPNENYEY